MGSWKVEEYDYKWTDSKMLVKFAHSFIDDTERYHCNLWQLELNKIQIITISRKKKNSIDVRCWEIKKFAYCSYFWLIRPGKLNEDI